jgi:di/tricarboxylate transporter
VLIVIAVAFAVLLTERMRNDVVAVLIILALWAAGLLTAEEALAGFSSEPAIVLAGIFVLGASLQRTGVSDAVGGYIGRAAGTGFTRAVGVIMPSVAVLSAFTHHVATTAVMLPVTLELSEKRGVPPSKLLIPLSFAASLGTTITIIGAPAFLVASEALEQAGEPRLGIFSITPIGLALTTLGTLFMVLAGRWLLPERTGAEDTAGRFRLDDYFTEVTILPGSPLLEKSSSDLESDTRYRMRVVGRVRGRQRLPGRFDAGDLEEGDVLLVRTSADQLLAVVEESGIELHPTSQYHSEDASSGDRDAEPADRFVQAVLAPTSDFAGRTIAQIDLRRRFGAIAISMWRAGGWRPQELAQTRLEPGDVLVLQGDGEALGRVANDRNFLMLVPFQVERRVRRRAPVAAAIMVATVLAAAVGVPLEIAGIAGAIGVVLTGCLTPGEAYRSIDQRIFVFIAGAVPLGAALDKSGAASMIAGWFEQAIGSAPPLVILLVLFAIVALITQLLSDSATTALFAPVAIALAQSLDQSPTAYVVTVAMAAVTSFLTPMGHHGNLLVYAPGGYRFRDFVVVGTPLTVIVAVAVALIALAIY